MFMSIRSRIITGAVAAVIVGGAAFGGAVIAMGQHPAAHAQTLTIRQADNSTTAPTPSDTPTPSPTPVQAAPAPAPTQSETPVTQPTSDPAPQQPSTVTIQSANGPVTVSAPISGSSGHSGPGFATTPPQAPSQAPAPKG